MAAVIDSLVVRQFLHWRCFDDAILHAELIHRREETIDSASLLAKCYHFSGDHRMCFHLLDGFSLSDLPAETKLYYADSAFRLNRFDEVERICTFGSRDDYEAVENKFEQYTAPIMKLLGDCYRRRNRIDQAIECYRRCMLFAPYMLSVFQILSELDDTLCERFEELLTSANVRKLLTAPGYVHLDFKNQVGVSSEKHDIQSSTGDIPDENEISGALSKQTSSANNRQQQQPVPKRPTGEALRTRASKNADDMSRNPTTQQESTSHCAPSERRGSTVGSKPLVFGVSSNEMIPSTTTLPPPPLTSINVKAQNTNKRTKISNFLPRKSQSRKITNKQCADSATARNPLPSSLSTQTNLISNEANTATTSNKKQSILISAGTKTAPPCRNERKNVGYKLRRSLTDSTATKSIRGFQDINKVHILPSYGKGPTTRLQHRQLSTVFGHKPITINSSKATARCSERLFRCAHPICKFNSGNQCSINNSNKCLVELVKTFTQLYHVCLRMKRNQFNEALSKVEEMSLHVKNMHWTMMQKAYAQYELGQYTSAVSTFKRIRLQYPMHMESMAKYSTVLWHLKARSDLVNLAQVLSELDFQHPSVWCTLGNHYSLSKEHDVAIHMFKRALQLDPRSQCALALLGNEYMAADNHMLATSCFRILLKRDIRDYRAWYGLGAICFSREKYQLAQVYYERAVNANPSSTVLMCHVAITKHVRGYTRDALELLTKAVSIDPNNSVCRFHRAGLLYSMNFLTDALKELKILEELVPNEPVVFHMFARIYRKMRNEQLFLAHVNWAMKLDRKRPHHNVKDSIDRFYARDDDVNMEDTTSSVTRQIEETTNVQSTSVGGPSPSLPSAASGDIANEICRMFRSTPITNAQTGPFGPQSTTSRSGDGNVDNLPMLLQNPFATNVTNNRVQPRAGNEFPERDSDGWR